MGSDKSASCQLGEIQEKTADVLKRGGVISQRLRNFEFREEQLQMAEAISKAIEAGRKALYANPRVDMPGAKPKPYPRDYGKLYSGFAGP